MFAVQSLECRVLKDVIEPAIKRELVSYLTAQFAMSLRHRVAAKQRNAVQNTRNLHAFFPVENGACGALVRATWAKYSFSNVAGVHA